MSSICFDRNYWSGGSHPLLFLYALGAPGWAGQLPWALTAWTVFILAWFPAETVFKSTHSCRVLLCWNPKHFPMESLSSEKSLKSRSFPCLGPSGATKFPADCVLRERTVHCLVWVEIKSHLPLKIASTSMGMVGFDQRWLPILQGLNTIPHQFSQIQVQQAVNTSFAPCGGAEMPQC